MLHRWNCSLSKSRSPLAPFGFNPSNPHIRQSISPLNFVRFAFFWTAFPTFWIVSSNLQQFCAANYKILTIFKHFWLISSSFGGDLMDHNVDVELCEASKLSEFNWRTDFTGNSTTSFFWVIITSLLFITVTWILWWWMFYFTYRITCQTFQLSVKLIAVSLQCNCIELNRWTVNMIYEFINYESTRSK